MSSYPKSNELYIYENDEKQRKSDNEFWMNCAISAMQGMQESGTKISILSDVFPNETAKFAFDMADAMLEELKKRRSIQKEKKRPSLRDLDR